MLYDHHVADKDDKVGEAHISVYELKERAAEDIWVDVEGIKPEKSADHYKAIYYLPTSVKFSYNHCLKQREDHGRMALICLCPSAAFCAYSSPLLDSFLKTSLQVAEHIYIIKDTHAMQGPIGKAKHLKDMAGGPVGRIKRKIGSTKSRKFRIHLKVLPSISQATVLVCYCAVSFDGHLSNFWQVYSYLVSHLLLVIVVFCEQTPSKLTGGELHLVRWQARDTVSQDIHAGGILRVCQGGGGRSP